MKKSLVAAAAVFCASVCAIAQNGGPAVTQVLIDVDSQAGRVPAQSDITLKVNGKAQPLTGWLQVPPDQLQIADLVDNNRLKKEVGEHLDSLRAFATSLPTGSQLYTGYMTDDGIETVQPFTADHGQAASSFRRPSGVSRVNVGPYACVSKFVKNWPKDSARPSARVVLLLTTGIDYSPDFAAKAAEDAQRAGVTVFAIYLNDQVPPSRWGARRGLPVGDSPIDALDEVTGGTGGHAYYEPSGDQRPLADYLDRFRGALANMYVASFVAHPLQAS